MQQALRRNRTLLINLAFGGVLVGATYALADIRSVKYSQEAASVEYSDASWNSRLRQAPKPIDAVLREFADSSQPDDDYPMLNSLSKPT